MYGDRNTADSPRGVKAKVLDCGLEVNGFELQSQYYVCFRTNHHHHHHVVPLARISLTLSRHFSLSFIASGRSSGLHPVSSHSCWMYVRAGRPAFARPYVGVHRSTSLMSSSLLIQQCPTCLVRQTSTPHKAPTIRPPASHHENYPSSN